MSKVILILVGSPRVISLAKEQLISQRQYKLIQNAIQVPLGTLKNPL